MTAKKEKVIKEEPFNVGKWAVSCLGCGRTDEEVTEIATKVGSYLAGKQMEANWDNCFIAYQAIINGME